MAEPTRPDSGWPPGSEPTPPPGPPTAGIWSTWSQGRLLLWAFLLLASDFAVQIVVYGLVDDLFLPVAAGGIVAILLPCFLVARVAGGSLASEFQLGATSGGNLLWAVLAAVAALLPTSLLAELSARIHPVPDSWIEFYTEHLPQGPLPTVLAAATVIIVAPLAEELLFRGILHRLARRLWGPTAATLLSSVAFGLVHGEAWVLFGLIGLGFLLAYIYEMTRSVTACFACHAAYNGISFYLMLKEKDMVIVTSGGGMEDIALLAGSLLLLGFACMRLARGDSRH